PLRRQRAVRARARGRDRFSLRRRPHRRPEADVEARVLRPRGRDRRVSVEAGRVMKPALAETGDKQKQERRRQILAAAKAVFAEAGYHGASIHAIIERAQIARGTFYLYFESKAAVFDSILDEAMRDLRGRIHRIDVETPDAPPPQLQLR